MPKRGEVPAHESYYYLELLRRAGWIDRLPAVERIALSVSEEARERGRQTLLAAGARPDAAWIAFAPGAAYGSAKCWPPERYAALADRLIDASDADVILFGAPQESEMAARIMRRDAPPRDQSGREDEHRGAAGAACGVPAVHRQRFRRDARGGRGGLAGGGDFWPDRSRGHVAGDAAIPAGAPTGFLQSLFSAALSDRSSLHDAHLGGPSFRCGAVVLEWRAGFGARRRGATNIA